MAKISVDVKWKADDGRDSCKVLIERKQRRAMLQGNRCDQSIDSRNGNAFGSRRSKNARGFLVGSKSNWFKNVPLRKILLDRTHITPEALQHLGDDNSCQRKRLRIDDHAAQFGSRVGRRRTEEINPDGAIDQDQGPPESNPVFSCGLYVAAPDSASIVSENALAAFRTD